MPSPQITDQRRNKIIRILSARPCTLAEIRERLQPSPSERSLQKDITWLAEHFPGRITFETIKRAKVWSFQGETPRILAQSLVALDEDQITALIAARGLLRIPDVTDASIESHDAYHGALAQAIDRLLTAVGLADEARAIAPDAITISRFGVAPEEDASFPLTLAAIRSGESQRFSYTNLDGTTHAVHAHPIRLVHIAGEWHLLAWAPDAKVVPGKMKQYRLSRMTGVTNYAKKPDDCPLMGLRAEASDILRNAFRATGSAKLNAQRTVILAISPKAWPFIEHRRWGDKLTCQEHQPDLPTNWRRLRFVTTGLLECRHWVLSFGQEIRAESPAELVTWLREQAQAILTATQPTTGQTNSESSASGKGDRVRE